MKVAFVTGANGGFGKLISIELLKAGFIVIAAMRNTVKQQELVETAKQLQLENNLNIIEMDVTEEKQIIAARDWLSSKYKYLDVLVNNAGYSQGGFISDLDIGDWERQMDTNLLGVIRTTKYFLPFLKNAERGQIINVSSVSGFFGFPGLGPYVTSKFALEGFSESLRLELQPDNIYVSLVEPASFKTGIWEKGLELAAEPQEKDILKRNTFQYAKKAYENAGDPTEVARLVRKITEAKKPKLRYRVGKSANTLWNVKKIIPWSIVEKAVLHKLMNK